MFRLEITKYVKQLQVLYDIEKLRVWVFIIIDMTYILPLRIGFTFKCKELSSNFNKKFISICKISSVT